MLSASQFGVSDTFSLPLSPSLQSEIAYGMALQLLAPVQRATILATPTQAVKVLEISLAHPSGEAYSLGILKADGSETIRTIEIYDIQVSGAGDILLKVMDRQSGEKRTFRIDRIQAYTIHRSAYTVERPADLTPVTPKAFCSSCSYLCEADELAPDHNGDPTCTDCLSSWEGLPDNAGGFTFAYAR